MTGRLPPNEDYHPDPITGPPPRPEDNDLAKLQHGQVDADKYDVNEIRKKLLHARELIQGWPCPSDECRSELVRNAFLARNQQALDTLDTYNAVLAQGKTHGTITFFLANWDRATAHIDWSNRVGIVTLFVSMPDGEDIPGTMPPPLDQVMDPVEAEAPNPPSISEMPAVTPASGPIPQNDHTESS